jgi:hypothetical protein
MQDLRQMKHLQDALRRGMIMAIFLSSLLLIAGAETVNYCDSIHMQMTDWNSSVNLPKFDPEMGTLTGVDLKCVSNLSRGISQENMNNNSANFVVSIMGGLIVVLPNSENISMNVNQSFEGRLPGFDGGKDYSGISGLNKSDIIAVEPAFKSYLAIDDFKAGFAGEKAVLPVMTSFSTLVRSSGSASSRVTLRADASVCIFYTYEPKDEKEGGS